MKIQCYEKFIADQSAGSVAVSVREVGEHSVTRASLLPPVLLNTWCGSAQRGQGFWDRLILASFESFI